MIDTSWVKGPQQITGLDHLGVQAPCINIYAQLLPGITNVTDRARYYSFYPWLLMEMDQAGYIYDDKFIMAFRRADALFTLISLRHQEECDDGQHHAAAAVGTLVLQKALHTLRNKKLIKLSSYSSIEAGEDRYFKNKLGGLGQYYLGVLRALHLMSGNARNGVNTIHDIGGLLAKNFSNSLPTDVFMKAVKDDEVSLQVLDKLSGFCLCQLHEYLSEKEALVQLFSGVGPYQGHDEYTDNESHRRKHSLIYFLEMADAATTNGLSFDIDTFRGMAYSRAVSVNKPLNIDSSMDEITKGWASYQRNELLSVALQGLFFACLRSYELSNMSFNSIDELATWFWRKGAGYKTLLKFKNISSFNKLRAHMLKKMPAFENWQEDEHEIQSMFKLRSLSRGNAVNTKDINTIIISSLRILTSLVGRDENKPGYENLYFPKGYFDYYPINLNSLEEKLGESVSGWSGLKIEDCMIHVMSEWCLGAHLRVALRKLRLQSQSTFRFMPTDHGLEIIDIPSVANTQPRFRQAQAILEDIGLLVKDAEGWLSPIENAAKLMKTGGITS